MSAPAGSRFPKAPIVEVVCGVQFDGLKWGSVDFGRLADSPRFKATFNHYDERAPIPAEGSLVLHLGEQVPDQRRVMYVEQGGNRLAQVQGDRFLANWRRVKQADKYPSFGPTYAFFKEFFGEVTKYSDAQKIGRVVPTGFELTYINHVPLDQGSKPMAPFKVQLGGLEPAVEGSVMMFAVPVGGPADGAVQVKIQTPVQRIPDMAQLAFLELTAKVAFRGVRDMDGWFDQAHARANDLFDKVTGDDYKTKWRQP